MGNIDSILEQKETLAFTLISISIFFIKLCISIKLDQEEWFSSLNHKFLINTAISVATSFIAYTLSFIGIFYLVNQDIEEREFREIASIFLISLILTLLFQIVLVLYNSIGAALVVLVFVILSYSYLFFKTMQLSVTAGVLQIPLIIRYLITFSTFSFVYAYNKYSDSNKDDIIKE